MSVKDQAISASISAGIKLIVLGLKKLGNFIGRAFMIAVLCLWVADTARAGTIGVGDFITPANPASAAFSGVLLASTVPQEIASGVVEAVDWQTETYDIGGWHAGTSTDVIIPAGVSKIRIVCSISWEAGLVGYRTINLRIEGTTVVGASAVTLAPSLSGNMVMQNVSAVISVSEADVIICQVKHLQAAPLDVNNGTATYFSVQKVE